MRNHPLSVICMRRVVTCLYRQQFHNTDSSRHGHGLTKCHQTKTLTTCCKFRPEHLTRRHMYSDSVNFGSVSSLRHKQNHDVICRNLSMFNPYRTISQTSPILKSFLDLGFRSTSYKIFQNTQSKSYSFSTSNLSGQLSNFHTGTYLNIKDDNDTSHLHLDPEMKSLFKEMTQDFADEHSLSGNHGDKDGEGHDPTVPSSPESDQPVLQFSVGDCVMSGIDENSQLDEEFDNNDEVEYDDIYEQRIPISLERGKSGVYDIEEMVHLLKDDNAQDLCVIQVPPEKNYTDYLVIATGRSTRHLRAMAKNIQWIYKKKRISHDPKTLQIEGLDSTDWLALDIGNMVVHLFLSKTRALYDLEILWTLGEEYDEKTHEQTDTISDMKSWVTSWSQDPQNHS